MQSYYGYSYTHIVHVQFSVVLLLCHAPEVLLRSEESEAWLKRSCDDNNMSLKLPLFDDNV